MKWSARKRIEFIENRLFWEGGVSRKDLTDYFEISIPQSTKDIKKYMEIAPNNIVYDNSAKKYVITDSFNPQLISIDSESYLTQLIHTDLRSKLFYFGSQPPFYLQPAIHRKAEPIILREVLKNIRQHNAILIEYQSMSTPEPSLRWITPHAIGYDGFRWHVRAFCHKDRRYKDFNIGRIFALKEERLHLLDFENDFEWFTEITFEIIPHKNLTSSQRKCIEFDYGMENGILTYDVKAAFVFYVLKRLKLEKGHEKRPPNEQQIILNNQDEIFNELAFLKKMSSERTKDFEIFQPE